MSLAPPGACPKKKEKKKTYILVKEMNNDVLDYVLGGLARRYWRCQVC